jgi:transposase
VSDTVDLASDPEAQIAALRADLAAANAALAARDVLIETLRVQIARMRRMKFGASSEKLDHAIAQLELALEELETEASTVAQSKPVAAKVERPAPVRSFPPHLPREEIIHEPAQGSCTCPDCGGTLRRLSADSDEMLDVVPVHWRVIRHVRPKYSCRACEKIVQAPAPVKAIARGSCI